jgi:hypothetical protein
MYIHDFFQNFLKTFLVYFHGAFTSSMIAPDILPAGCRPQAEAPVDLFYWEGVH